MLNLIQSFEEYLSEYQKSVDNPEKFWSEIAEKFSWQKKWTSVLSGKMEDATIKWFDGGVMNITENMLDRFLPQKANDTALIWEANNPNEKSVKLSYRELYVQVCKTANALKSLGVKKGDRVCLYLPMIPELAISVMACARIGAIHSVVFAGFSAQALADRINDSECKLVITSDGLNRGSKQVNLKEIVDEALQQCTCVGKVLVKKHTNNAVAFKSVDVDFDTLVEKQNEECKAEPMQSEDPLFILYTSGSTGKPKGVVHSTAGYMVYAAYSFKQVFGYEEGDVHWCSADIGWVTGHSYIVYGPLLNGGITIMFEGVPTYPTANRFWEVIEKHKVKQFYTAPTAIRALMACADGNPGDYKMDSLKVLGTVGEPINEEAWQWYYKQVGKENLPIVDTWWQTETGGIMISGLHKISPLKPTYAAYPLPGIQPVLLNEKGEEQNGDAEGYLAIKHPWPSMIRTTWGSHKRCIHTYFSQYKGYYFTGDGARRDNGCIRVIGRVDDVINVSGHRFGTAEIENALDEHKAVVEAAVIGVPHAIKGQGIFAFVICKEGVVANEKLLQEMNETVVQQIGKIAKPECILVCNGLPKTRSGKIMRRILRKIAEGEFEQLGDISTLLNPEVVQKIIEARAKIKISVS